MRRRVRVKGNICKPSHDADANDHQSEQTKEHPTGRYVRAAQGNVGVSGAVAVGVTGPAPPAWRRQKPQHAGQRHAEHNQPKHHERESYHLIQRRFHARHPRSPAGTSLAQP